MSPRPGGRALHSSCPAPTYPTHPHTAMQPGGAPRYGRGCGLLPGGWLEGGHASGLSHATLIATRRAARSTPALPNQAGCRPLF